jgi:diguanylate cyclase (GGDEF)-like protein
VFFIDVDNLKIVNDGLGHSAGDRLLVAVAEELRQVAGDDCVARFGGDEFVVASRSVAPDRIADRADEFLAAVERAEVEGVSNHVSASIGVAMALGANADPERLIRDADAAMYAAKRGGRSRAALFDAALRRQVTRRFELEADLREAIAADALAVHFQPIVDLASGAVTGVEALCRWGSVSPGEFIPIAEESGLIVPLGASVLARALADGAQLQRALAHLHRVRVGVNVSARELDLPDFADRALAIIEAGPVPVDQVVLELTESVLIDPREEVDATLHRLKDAGITLALDDFGIGYSSLAYLRRYPLDVLKLDISYTQAMVTDPETRVIVESVVTMANRLDLQVVAEGIETAEQLAAAREVGASRAQGYLVGRPAPVDALVLDGLAPRTSLIRP